MRISDLSSDVCSSDLFAFQDRIILPIVAMRHRDLHPFTDKDMSILALTARATRLVLSCRATTLQPLSVSTRLFRHHINLLCFRPMARPKRQEDRSEEHTSELQSLMRTSYAVFCLKKKIT